MKKAFVTRKLLWCASGAEFGEWQDEQRLIDMGDDGLVKLLDEKGGWSYILDPKDIERLGIDIKELS